MGELTFVGLGLHDEKGISLRGLEYTRMVDHVFVEFYTSLMADLSVERLERLIGRRVSVVSRRRLEDEEGMIIFQKAMKGKVALLVPGDPLISTTHIDLRIRAEKKGIRTRIIHGVSVVSAVIGLSGLQNYKFGRSVTLPFSREKSTVETVSRVINENRKLGLHTLVFLDIITEERKYMTIKDGLQLLLSSELKLITPETLVVGIARAGSNEPVVKAGFIQDLINYDFGSVPHSLIFPGKLHFMEEESLIILAKAPRRIKNLFSS